MSTPPVDRLHPVVEFAEGLTTALDSLVEVPLYSMGPEDKRQALATLARGKTQLAYLELRLLAYAEETGATAETSAGSAADWLAVVARQVRRDARSDLKLATKLE